MPRKNQRSVRRRVRPKRMAPYPRKATTTSSTVSICTVTAAQVPTTSPVAVVTAPILTASQKKLGKSSFIDEVIKETLYYEK